MATITETFRDARAQRELTMDDLARMGVGELTARYREARAPSSLGALQGNPRGRMLAAVGPLGRGPARKAVAAIARQPLFPWLGKRFEAFDDLSGQGTNRLRLIGEKYRFELRFDESALDGQRCVRLDYDLPDNPFFVRPIRDELKQAAPGLFFGPAMIRTRTEPKLLFFFGVETG